MRPGARWLNGASDVFESIGSGGGRKEHLMARATTRPVVKLKSTAGTGVTYVTRKNRLNDPDRLVLRKYDPVAGGHVLFREER
ncbi:hypothetical protein SFUMM280S_09289 [Streptomyces fumanus]